MLLFGADFCFEDTFPEVGGCSTLPYLEKVFPLEVFSLYYLNPWLSGIVGQIPCMLTNQGLVEVLNVPEGQTSKAVKFAEFTPTDASVSSGLVLFIGPPESASHFIHFVAYIFRENESRHVISWNGIKNGFN